MKNFYVINSHQSGEVNNDQFSTQNIYVRNPKTQHQRNTSSDLKMDNRPTQRKTLRDHRYIKRCSTPLIINQDKVNQNHNEISLHSSKTGFNQKTKYRYW